MNSSRDRDDYRVDIRNGNRVARSMGWRIAVWVVAIVVFAGALSAGVWAFNVATSGTKGAGDATRQINSGTNRIGAQEHFQTLLNQVKAYDQQLDQAAADKKDHPGSDFWDTNYAGLVKTCIDARNLYNGDANKVTQAKWRDPELPYQIDATDPQYDCKETK